MYKHLLLLPAMSLALVLGGMTAAPAHAQDNVLARRVQKEHGMNLPPRGMTMAQVEHKYGKPLRKLPPRGGSSAVRPVIHRWVYPGYIVYFAHNYVVHSVLNTPAGNNTHPQDAH